MTDKIKERLYEISHYKYFHTVSFISIAIFFVLSFILNLIITIPILFLIICIFILLFFIIKSFKRFDLETIKKNKIKTIILSDGDCIFITLCILYGYIHSIIVAIFNIHIALSIILILLATIILSHLSTTIRNKCKKRIIE